MSDLAPAEVLVLMKLSGMEGLNETSIERHLQVGSGIARRQSHRAAPRAMPVSARLGRAHAPSREPPPLRRAEACGAAAQAACDAAFIAAGEASAREHPDAGGAERARRGAGDRSIGCDGSLRRRRLAGRCDAGATGAAAADFGAAARLANAGARRRGSDDFYIMIAQSVASGAYHGGG